MQARAEGGRARRENEGEYFPGVKLLYRVKGKVCSKRSQSYIGGGGGGGEVPQEEEEECGGECGGGGERSRNTHTFSLPNTLCR